MPIKTFTMEEIDDEIVQIIEQSQVSQTPQQQPPNILEQLMAKAKVE